MKKKILIFIKMNNHLVLNFILLFQLVSYIINLKCEDRDIPNCQKCNEDICEQCEDKYFLLFDGLACIKCNDSVYGNIGCEGKCDGSNYITTRNIKCEENGCKSGYYNYNGICQKCSQVSYYCSKCQYTQNKFKCLECKNDNYAVSEITGGCEECFMSHCYRCHYLNKTKNTKCDECYSNYYINENGTCSYCYRNISNHESCRYCPDKQNCYCDSGYTYDDSNNCVECPPNCNDCKYNYITKSIECMSCKNGYLLNFLNSCVNCGDNCYSCKLSYNNINPICEKCFDGYTFDNENNCTIKYPKNCSSCYYNNETLLCNSCYNNFVMNKSNYCIPCNQDEEIGGKVCLSCQYLISIKKNICKYCSYNYINITDEQSCIEPNKIQLSKYCTKAVNLGNKENPKYSCITCKSSAVSIYNNEGIMNCYPKETILENCQNGTIDEEGNLICTKCLNN